MKIFVLVFLLPVTFCFSQTKKDTLLSQLNILDEKYHDSIYYELFRLTVDKNDFEALEYCTKSYKKSLENNNEVLEIKNLHAIGYCNFKIRNYPESETFLFKAISRSNYHKHYFRLLFIYKTLGDLYLNQQLFDKSIINYFEALDECENGENQALKALILNQVGLIQLRTKNFHDAINYFNQSIVIKNELGDINGISISQLNIADSYKALQNYDSSKFYYYSVLNNNKAHSNSILGNTLPSLGHIYLLEHDLDSAKFFFENYYTFYKDDSSYLEIFYGNLADYLFELNRFDSAAVLLNYSSQLSKINNNYSSLITNYVKLSELFAKIKNPDSALYYSEMARMLKDSLALNDKINALKKAYVDINTKNSNILIKEKDNMLKQNRLTILILGGVGLILMIILLVYLKLSKELKLNNIQLEKKVQDRTHDLNNFLYRSSHDLAGPIASLEGLFKIVTSSKNSNIKDYQNEIDSLIDRLKNIIVQLKDVSLNNTRDLDIQEIILDDFAESLLQNYQVGSLIFPTYEVVGKPKFHTDLALFSIIIKSLIENSLNHIDKREPDPYIKIVFINNDRLRIQVSDSGTGIMIGHEDKLFDIFFTGENKEMGLGLGLFYAKIAVDKLKGTIGLKNPRKPTIFEVDLPALI